MMERVGVDGRGADCLYEASQCSKIASMLKSPENTGQTMTKKLLMANEAFAHAALEAGVRVVAGYPGTPSSELIETVARLHAEGHAHGVHVEWSTNEKAALELLAGASYAGARCLFTCKQVGLNVASDALMSLNYVGCGGGLVLFVADDPGPISSQTEQDTRRFAGFAKVPVLDPSTPEEGFAMMKAAFDLSERHHTPVIVRPTTRICHASTFFDVQDETVSRPLPEGGFRKSPKWVIFPRRAWEAHGEINERLRCMQREFCEPPLSRFNSVTEVAPGGSIDLAPSFTGAEFVSALDAQEAMDDVMEWEGVARPVAETADAPSVGVVAGGVSAAYAREALRMLEQAQEAAGKQLPAYRFMQVGTPFPFPEDLARSFLKGLDNVVVFEELDHVLEDGLVRTIVEKHLACSVLGRSSGMLRDRGENSTEDILNSLTSFFGVYADADLDRSLQSRQPFRFEGDLPTRPPVLCAGCPHRGSFYAVKRALGKKEAVLCGDIGCYTLGNAAPLDAVDTCLCMGGGITMAQGFSVVEPQKKQVAFVGDSTFFASGLTGIANAVYNGHDITVCVLDNATTAMTGAQPHPGTGVTLMGEHRKPIDIEAVLRALGVECIVCANPLDLHESVAAAAEAIEYAGPSALIFQSPCVQLKKPDPAAMVNPDLCTGCKKCITEIGCPAIGFDAGAQGPRSRNRGQAFIDSSQCNGCKLCTQVCPFKSIVLTSDSPADAAAARGATNAEEANHD